MTDTERELWNRIESLEDLVLRISWKLGYPERVKQHTSEDALLASYRQINPYKSGDPEHWKRNQDPT